MSAAERLKALDGADYTGPTAREESIGLALSSALPQIVAVIEAAEALPEFFQTTAGGKHSFVPLLDALDEVLP